MAAKVKISREIKSIFVCTDCGVENEVSGTSPPKECYNCRQPNFKQTAKMEVSTTVAVTQLPFKGA